MIRRWVCALAWAVAASATQAVAQEEIVRGMPLEARSAAHQLLVARGQHYLARFPDVAGLDDLQEVQNVKLLDVIASDIYESNRQPLALGNALLRQRARLRLELYRLGSSNIPDALLQEVRPGLDKAGLIAESQKIQPDQKVLEFLRGMFPEKFGPASKSGTYLYHPKTPLDPQIPGITTLIPPLKDPNRSTGHVRRDRFKAVGALVDVSQSPHKIVCSGTMVSKSWFLTATHCLFDSSKASLRSLQTLSIFVPFQNGKETIYTEDARKSENMLRINLGGEYSWFGEALQKKDLPTGRAGMERQIENGLDVLLLKVQTVDMPNAFTALEVPPFSPIAAPVTLAGYGRTDVKYVFNENLLEIGSQTDQITPMQGGVLFVLAPEVGTGKARICNGDSGGPVFAGDLNGDEPGGYRLFALASAVEGAHDSACAKGRQTFTRLDRPEVRQWLCTKTAVGC
jgi:hypothetical protein